MAALPGIFCLEGEWNPEDLSSRTSVEPILDLLERLGLATTIHRDVATTAELTFYLGKWVQRRYVRYPILYLACDGDAGALWLGSDGIGFDELAALLEGKCAGRTLLFGACLTLKLPDEDLLGFVRRTGAKAVVGYEKPVDWLDSAAFETLLLERLARGNRTDGFFHGLRRDHGGLAQQLGLVAATATRVYR